MITTPMVCRRSRPGDVTMLLDRLLSTRRLYVLKNSLLSYRPLSRGWWGACAKEAAAISDVLGWKRARVSIHMLANK
jgi:hypothetical protein